MIKSVVSAAALSLMACSVTWALPAPSLTTQLETNSSDLLKVGKKGDRDRDKHKSKRDWRDDHADDYDDKWRDRYRYRYSYRPDDWEDRGCINVGPLWYCS